MPDTVERDARETAGAVRIAGLDHVVLRVASLERAIEFYGKVLGLRVERELQQPRLVQLRAGASLIDWCRSPRPKARPRRTWTTLPSGSRASTRRR